MRPLPWFYIYAESDKYVLLGTRVAFAPYDDRQNIKEVVLGWVPMQSICRWNGEAVGWNGATNSPDAKPNGTQARRDKPVKIYATPRDAVSGLEGGAAVVLASEKFDARGVSRTMPQQIRYPVLRPDPLDGIMPTRQGNTLLRLAVPIEAPQADPTESGSAADLRERLRVLGEHVTRTEVLFVVQDTLSMARSFELVAQAVEVVAKDAEARPDRSVRIAVTYYHDSKDGSPVVVAQPLSDLKFPENGVVQGVRTHELTGGGDPRQPLFQGLVHGIDVVRFSSAVRKLMVVIGQLGDREIPGDPNVSRIALGLVPESDSPVEFCAIQIASDVANDNSRAFMEQMQGIIRACENRYVKAGFDRADAKDRFTVIAASGEGSRDFIESTIAVRLRGLQNRGDHMRQKLEELNQVQPNYRVEPEIGTVLNRHGLTVDALQKTSIFPRYQVGFAWLKDSNGIEQFRTNILRNQLEIKTVLRVFAKLNNSSPVISGKESWTAVAADIANLANETNNRGLDDPSISDFATVARRLQFQSPLLRSPPERFRGLPVELKELSDVRLHVMRLQDVLDGVNYRYRRVSFDRGGQVVDYWEREAASRVLSPRSFRIAGDPINDWYWVDLDEWP